jgi:hypothetical protein
LTILASHPEEAWSVEDEKALLSQPLQGGDPKPVVDKLYSYGLVVWNKTKQRRQIVDGIRELLVDYEALRLKGR